MFVIIAAVGKNLELGIAGGLIWHLPNDLRFFREKTNGHKVFMGRNTFLSLPKKLPNREHFVLTDCEINSDEDINLVTDFNEYVNKNKDSEEEIFVIGGGMVYKQILPYVKKMYLTEINANCPNADVFFPKFDLSRFKRSVLFDNEDNGIKYTHVKYVRY